MQSNKLTHQKILAIQVELADALRQIGDKHGLNFDVGDVRFDAAGFKTSLKCRVRGVTLFDTPRGRAFVQHARIYGLDGDDLGKVIIDGRKRLKITGLNANAPKNCIELECVDSGKTWRAPPAWVAQRLWRRPRDERSHG